MTNSEMTYNTQRKDLIITEYGRNIQNMVDHIKTIEDKDERNRAAKSIIQVMGQLFPYLRDIEDFRHKLWDHLHIMSNFELELDSPYPKPSRETFNQKPNQMTYPQTNMSYGHYGKIIEKIIEQVCLEQDETKREEQIVSLGNLMKKTYLIWNRDSVDDSVIAKQMFELSKGRLKLSNPSLLQATSEILAANKVQTNSKRKTYKNNGPGGGKFKRRKK
jgi:hypothetical protein